MNASKIPTLKSFWDCPNAVLETIFWQSPMWSTIKGLMGVEKEELRLKNWGSYRTGGLGLRWSWQWTSTVLSNLHYSWPICMSSQTWFGSNLFFFALGFMALWYYFTHFELCKPECLWYTIWLSTSKKTWLGSHVISAWLKPTVLGDLVTKSHFQWVEHGGHNFCNE